MIAEIFNTAGGAITGMTGLIGDGVTGIVSLFWDATASKLTIPGTLGVVGLGIGVFYFAFRWVRSLMKARG